jgi:hypothetical protein
VVPRELINGGMSFRGGGPERACDGRFLMRGLSTAADACIRVDTAGLRKRSPFREICEPLGQHGEMHLRNQTDATE